VLLTALADANLPLAVTHSKSQCVVFCDGKAAAQSSIRGNGEEHRLIGKT